MKRILVIAHGSNHGGAEHCLDTTLQHLDRSSWQVTALFPYKGPMECSAHTKGIDTKIINCAWWMCLEPSFWMYRHLLGIFGRVFRLVHWMKTERIDLVYSNTAVVFEGAIAAWLANVPHIWHVHEILTKKHMQVSLLPVSLITRLIGLLSKNVIFESEAAREICRDRIPKSKSTVVPNSLRLTLRQNPKKKNNLCQNNEVCSDETIVVFVGQFSHRKNPLMLIRAIPRMRNALFVKFLFVGTGPLQHEMAATIDRLGMTRQCRIIPFQPDIRPVLEAADVLVLTSEEESFGLVLIEAGAYECPVVATRTQGPQEIVVDGETGYLVEPGNEEQLAEKLELLTSSAALRKKMGRAGANRVRELFSAEKNTAKIETVFRKALSIHSQPE